MDGSLSENTKTNEVVKKVEIQELYDILDTDLSNIEKVNKIMEYIKQEGKGEDLNFYKKVDGEYKLFRISIDKDRNEGSWAKITQMKYSYDEYKGIKEAKNSNFDRNKGKRYEIKANKYGENMHVEAGKGKYDINRVAGSSSKEETKALLTPIVDRLKDYKEENLNKIKDISNSYAINLEKTGINESTYNETNSLRDEIEFA